MNRTTAQPPNSALQWRQFYALTFAISWGLWLPGYLITRGYLEPGGAFGTVSEIGKWLGGIGPSAAAIFLVARSGGWKAVKNLLGRILRLRLGVWYLPVFLLLPVAAVAAHLINTAFGGVFPSTGPLGNPATIPLLFAVFFVLQVSEEYGWRGYALVRLQEDNSALRASLIVGAAWSVWHIPMFLIDGFGLHDNGVPLAQFAITLMSLSVIITWLQNNTGGSIIPAFVVHAMINLTGEVLPLHAGGADAPGPGAVGPSAWTIANIILIACAVVVITVYGPRTMTRRRTSDSLEARTN